MKEKNEKKRFNIFNLIVNAIALFAVVVFFTFLYSSYTNFNEVKNGNKPSGYKEVKNYIKEGRDVTIYKYNLYKIVIIKYFGTETYYLKPIISNDY